MATIGWTPSTPDNNDLIGLGAGVIRSIQTSVQQAVDDEHNFPASGGANTGYHKFGSARPYYAPVSQVSSTGTDSRLMLTSDTSELYSLNSSKAFLVGGALPLLLGSAAVASSAAYIPAANGKLLVQCGNTNTGSSGASTGWARITFGSAFSGVPLTFLSVHNQGAKAAVVYNSSNTFLEIFSFTATSGVSGVLNVDWMSIGTVSTGQP